MHSRLLIQGIVRSAFPLLLLAGCSDETDGLSRQAVSGTVTLDGQPLKLGSIQFLPVSEKEATTGGGVITAGKYAIAREQGLAPGSYRVVINGGEGSPAPAGPPGAAPTTHKELVPARYNEKTTLTAEVKPGETNAFEFALTSK